jgi:hypothetical protein
MYFNRCFIDNTIFVLKSILLKLYVIMHNFQLRSIINDASYLCQEAEHFTMCTLLFFFLMLIRHGFFDFPTFYIRHSRINALYLLDTASHIHY